MNDNSQDKDALKAKFLQIGDKIVSEKKKGVSYPEAIKKEIKSNPFVKKIDKPIETISKVYNQDKDNKSGFFKRFFSAIWRLIKVIVWAIIIALFVLIIYVIYDKKKQSVVELQDTQSVAVNENIQQPPIVKTEPSISSSRQPVVEESAQTIVNQPPTIQAEQITSTSQQPVAEENTQSTESTQANTTNNLIYGRFYKVSAKGETVSETAELGSGEGQWQCTFDKESGLIWDIAGKQRATWFNPNPTTNGGDAGYKSNKDSYSVIKAYNQASICGITNWRLPLINEVESIIKLDLKRAFPQLAMELFSSITSDWYWTSQTGNTNAKTPSEAVSFNIAGHDREYRVNSMGFEKTSSRSLFLVGGNSTLNN